MEIQNEQKTECITIQAGIRAGFWTAFGAGGGDLQIVSKGGSSTIESYPKALAAPTPTTPNTTP